MNWKEINKKHPKSFDLFFTWFKGDPKATMKKKEFLDVNDIVVMHGDLRELYDFFDEQKLIISIDSGIISLKTYERRFSWDIYIGEGVSAGEFEGCKYKTRGEAEQVAFLEAFEMLETKLNK